MMGALLGVAMVMVLDPATGGGDWGLAGGSGLLGITPSMVSATGGLIAQHVDGSVLSAE